MIAVGFTPNRLRHFAEMQYLAQWEQKYRTAGGWPIVASGSLSSEQLEAMYPFVEALIRDSEASERPFLNRLDSITKYFFTEWLKAHGIADLLVRERHPLRRLSVKDIETIFERMVEEHKNGTLFELQHWLIEANHSLDNPRTDLGAP